MAGVKPEHLPEISGLLVDRSKVISTLRKGSVRWMHVSFGNGSSIVPNLSSQQAVAIFNVIRDQLKKRAQEIDHKLSELGIDVSGLESVDEAA